MGIVWYHRIGVFVIFFKVTNNRDHLITFERQDRSFDLTVEEDILKIDG